MSDDHRFSYALMPHLKSFQEAGVIQAAYAFNSPLKVAKFEELIHLDKSIAEPLAKVCDDRKWRVMLIMRTLVRQVVSLLE